MKTELEKPSFALSMRGINKTFPGVKALRSIIIDNKTPQDLEIPDTKQKFIATKMIRKGEGAAYLKKCQEWKKGG